MHGDHDFMNEFDRLGADDSASGCAVMLEAARVLKKLIDEGKLPMPERSLRWLFMSECYGSHQYNRKRCAVLPAGQVET